MRLTVVALEQNARLVTPFIANLQRILGAGRDMIMIVRSSSLLLLLASLV